MGQCNYSKNKPFWEDPKEMEKYKEEKIKQIKEKELLIDIIKQACEVIIEKIEEAE